ncbi:caspase, EACC1-associated type [Nocardia amamiensis]|uniref:caspase, EACC1-associated type n=1 Tax=Nocardia amamiensis TaxID=404578 RepID=UPI00083185DB|nr:caspase family protein [Nocardia amamiensis]
MVPQPDHRVGARAALLVATSTYSDPGLNALRAPAQDVAALRKVLADPEIGGFTVTDVLDQPEYAIRRTIDKFLSGRRVEDVVVVYLSCHGVLDRRGNLYFAATDTDKQQLSSTALESSWLLNRLDECRARSQVVILDCCFSGAFDRTKTGGDIDLERRLVGNSRGRAVLTASRAEEYSYEGVPLSDDTPDAETGSAFTTGLIKGMADGSADRDGDGYISVEEAHAYAADYVRARGGHQSPQLWLYGAEGSIILARNPRDSTQLGWQFPAALRDGLASPYPTIRAAAVRTLGDFLTDPDAWPEAETVLKSIAAHDVPEVAKVARAVLRTREERLVTDRTVPPAPPWRRWALISGAASAVVVGLVAALVVVPAVVDWTKRCGDGVARVGPYQECVGVTDGSVVFAPELADIEERIRKENSEVASSGADHVSVVVLLPMTVRADDVVSVQWVRHHLEGTHLAQRTANDTKRWGRTPLIRLLLANAGSGLGQWRSALDELERLRAGERIVAVTGIGLSVDNAVHAMQRLAESRMPMIGSTVTADNLSEIDGFLRVSPTNAALAQAAANHAAGWGAKRAVLVRNWDPDDRYSATLGDEFTNYFRRGRFTGSTELYDSRSPRVDNTFNHMMPNICAAKPDVVFFAGRARHATTFIQALAQRKCTEVEIKVLTGDDMTFSPIPVSVGTALSTRVSVIYTELAHPKAWEGDSRDIFDTHSIEQFSDECRENQDKVCYRDLSADGGLDDAVAIIAYDAVLTAVQIIRLAAGDGGTQVDTGHVLQTMPRLSNPIVVSGASGKLSFDEAGNPVGKPVAMLEVLPGQPPKFNGLAWPDR